RPPSATPFPYTTLFRSHGGNRGGTPEVREPPPFVPHALRLPRRPPHAARPHRPPLRPRPPTGRARRARAQPERTGRLRHGRAGRDRKSTRLNSSHVKSS